MRPATFHDLMMASAAIVGACCLVIVLQIIIITKATIPADVMLSDIRVLRSEITGELNVVSQRLANIEAFISAQADAAVASDMGALLPQIHASAIEGTLRNAEGKGILDKRK